MGGKLSEGPPCVVVGLHQNGLGVARALGRRGVRVIAIDGPQRNAYGATRFAERVACPDLRGVGLIDTLEGIGKSLEQPGILVLTLDRSVLLVSEHREQIEPWFVHSLPPDAVIQRLMNKSDTEAFAAKHGFNVPRTYTILEESDLERCASEVGFPCILKPQVKTVEFVERSPKKAFFVRSRHELWQSWQMVSQWEPGVVVQQWIPGPETSLVFCLFYFDRDGRPLAWFTGRKLRQYIPHCGTACSAEPWRDDKCRDLGVRFFTEAGYSGFGAIEFKVDPGGNYYLIEPTVGRTEHIFALAVANGVNLPYVGYCDMAGLPPPGWRLRRRSVVYVDWKRDLRAARVLVEEGELTWLKWVRSVAAPQQHALFAWDDPGPIARSVTLKASHRTARALHRARRSLARRTEALRAGVGGTLDLGAACTPRAEPVDRRVSIQAALDWLCAAHDATGRKGVARGFTVSMRSGYPAGWQPAYPETTGYIVPTLLDVAADPVWAPLAERALEMADWLVTLQLRNGGFPGGTVDRGPSAVVFNTGMIVLGLTRAWEHSRNEPYRESLVRAADFLARAQSSDGAWRRYSNASGHIHLHAYDCLVNWGLLRAARILGEPRWTSVARRNLEFTLTLQRPTGWFSHNALRPGRNASPLTHTVGYVAAGLLESGVVLGDERFVEASQRVADALLPALGDDGFLAGEFDERWRPTVPWACLTGTAQLAIVWGRLFELRGSPQYADAARRAVAYVAARQELALGRPGVRGGIAGSFPVDGAYGRYQFLNWATKYFVDALRLLERLDSQTAVSQALAAAPEKVS